MASYIYLQIIMESMYVIHYDFINNYNYSIIIFLTSSINIIVLKYGDFELI